MFGRFAERYLRVHIQSLNYSEFLLFHNLSPSPKALAAYLRWGGLPFMCNIPAEDIRTRSDYLGSIYDTIFVKDIISRKNVRNVAFINNLARFVADNSGKLFSSNSIAKCLKNSGSSVSSISNSSRSSRTSCGRGGVARGRGRCARGGDRRSNQPTCSC